MDRTTAAARRLEAISLILLTLGVISTVTVSAQTARAPAKGGLTPAWLLLGRDLTKRGEFPQAIDVFENALKSGPMDVRGRVECLIDLGILRWNTDELEASLEALDGALSEAKSAGLADRSAYIQRMIDIERTFVRALRLRADGNNAGSGQAFSQALAGAEAIKSREHRLKILRAWSMSFLYAADGRGKYLELNLEALALAAALNHRGETSASETSIGTYYWMRGESSRALTHFLGALYVIQGQGSKRGIVRCLSNVATAYISLGDVIKANDYVSEALGIPDPGGGGMVASTLLINLGRIFDALGRSSDDPSYYERAKESFASYFGLPKSVRDPLLDELARVGVARVEIAAGEIAEAEADLATALKNAGKLKDAAIAQISRVELGGVALARGRTDEAEGHFRAALDAAGAPRSAISGIGAHSGLGRCYEEQGDYAKAVAEYSRAVEIVTAGGAKIEDDAQRAEFLSRSREPFQALMGLYFELSAKTGREAFVYEMFRLAESCRAGAFLDYAEQEKDPGGARDRTIARPEEMSLSAERLGYLERLSKGGLDEAAASELETRIRHIDDMLDVRIRDDRASAAAPAGLASAVSLSVLRGSLLPDDAAFIEYFLGDERSYVIGVTRTGLRVASLPAAGDLQDSLIAYLSFLENPRPPAAKASAAAHRLYLDLLAPVEGLLSPRTSHLIIVPDGVLFRLPFETLMPAPTGHPARDFLINRFRVSYAPSASALASLRRRPKSTYKKEVLAFGVSDYPRRVEGPEGPAARTPTQVLDDLYKRSGFSLSPIPYAGKEIEDLAAAAGPGRADVYAGPKAGEGLLKSLDLSAYRVIHFACHAFSDENYPLRSSLVLSTEADKEEDGYLQVSEMYRMRLSADLVVLSACQTGRGKVLKNAGLLGLPGVFFAIGGRSIVSTLWRIDDRSAASFMKAFYDGYFSGMGKAEALRRAKLKMIAARAGHPYYWAAYTLTGEF